MHQSIINVIVDVNMFMQVFAQVLAKKKIHKLKKCFKKK